MIRCSAQSATVLTRREIASWSSANCRSMSRAVPLTTPASSSRSERATSADNRSGAG